MPDDSLTLSIRPSHGRLQGDDGVAAVLVSFLMVVLLIIAALVTDLGLAYAGGRHQQNSADAAAMQATRQLMKVKAGTAPIVGCVGSPTVSCSTVLAQATLGVYLNGGAMAQCNVIENNAAQTVIAACSDTATWGTLTNLARASGVQVSSRGTTPTAFGKVIGYSSLSETRPAAATAQPLKQGTGPFYVCGGGQVNDSSLGDFNFHPPDALHPSPWPFANGEALPPLLRIDGTPMLNPASYPGLINTDMSNNPPSGMQFLYPPSRFSINPGAIGAVYAVSTPQSNAPLFADCNNHSANWKGTSDNSPVMNVPGVLDAGNGSQAGPTRTNIAAQPGCGSNLQSAIGCQLLLPLCPGSNGDNGTHYVMYCTHWGVFKIRATSNSGNRVVAEFVGGGTVASGSGGLGAGDPNAGTLVKLVQ